MNPALMNYLQQQSNAPQQGQTGGVQQTSAAPYNPFNAGITAAIESARTSLGMSEDQSNEALRSGIATFGQNIGNQPRVSGFLQNLGQIGRAALPAIGAYRNQEANAMSENNQIANQILNRQAQEQARIAQAEERTWHRDLAERQFAESARHNNFLEQFKKDQTKDENPISPLGPDFFPITDKKELTSYAIDKKLLGTTMHELAELKKNYKKFRTDYQDNIFDPMSAFGSITNKTKDTFGKFANNAALRRETADRKTLNSHINKFVIGSERSLRGGGVIGPKLIELFKAQEIYPDLEKDTPETFESKLKMLEDDIGNAYKASILSIKYKTKIDPSDVSRLAEPAMQKSSPQEMPEQPSIDNQGDTSDDYGFTEQ